VSQTRVSTLFFDIGGVILTNGWDRTCRRQVVDQFDLDWEEFADRHDFVAHDFEIGRITMARYLERTVFYRPREFSPADFTSVMFAASTALPGSLELLADLAGTGLFMATLNNESRELNEYRIDHFGLRRYFGVFLSSCYLGVKKPEPEIYRIALDVMQSPPAECLFIDDRDLNLECARDAGLGGVRFDSVTQLRDDLSTLGIVL
jgi:putative hydrolase of the HAD superfamily